MKIDVILATRNRAGFLGGALDSYFRATVPAGCEAHLHVVDNGSSDETRLVVQHFIDRYPGRIGYLFEPEPGKLFALNCGIRQSSGDVVAFFDDDELINPDWLEVLARTFADPAICYMGGPYRPEWMAPAPSWLPQQGWGGVLGIIDNGPARVRYGTPGFNAMPSGGNLAIRRRTLAECGEYKPKYVYAQDRYMYERLQEIAATGYYVPEFIVHHRIPAKRLTKRYFRAWAYNEGRNEGRGFRLSGERTKTLIGAAPWRWRALAEALTRVAGHWLTGRHGTPACFAAELEIRRFWGFYRAVNLPWLQDKVFDRT